MHVSRSSSERGTRPCVGEVGGAEWLGRHAHELFSGSPGPLLKETRLQDGTITTDTDDIKGLQIRGN